MAIGVGFSTQLSAQIVSDTARADSTGVDLIFPFSDNTGNPYLDKDQSPLFLNDPSNVKREIIYNPETNTYEFQSTIGDFTYRTPTVMSFDDFQKYQNKASVSA